MNEIKRRRSLKKMRLFALLCLGAFFRQKCVAIDIDDINLPNCTSGTLCEDSPVITTPFIEIVNDFTEKSNGRKHNSFTTESPKENDNFTTPTGQTTHKPSTTTEISITSTTVESDVEQEIDPSMKNRSGICTCDVKISSCDINCCCDVDCNDFQKSAFSRCDNHRPKMYDSRYCYTKNFIQRNNTQFILERLANNLFCVAYDNLPPISGMSDVPTLRNRQAFETAKYSVNPKKYTWGWPDSITPQDFNFSGRYRDKENLWKIQDNFVKLIDLPQSGFTGQCSFRKTLKYLEISKWTCMQTDLSGHNSYLFADKYINFTVISSPHLFNSSYINSANQSCPNNICLSPRTLYCSDHWSNCDSRKPLEQSCTNGKCTNVLKRLRYTFYHNGTSGIRSIEVRLVLVNVSHSFYQHFEVLYEWMTARSGAKLLRSGSPGYTIGKPIIFGTLTSNVTNGATKEHVSVNNSDYHLTLPIRGKNGYCISGERYVIGFGENVRLRCRHESTTNNFSASVTCMRLQNQTLRFMIEDSLRAVTQVDKYHIYISKAGDLPVNDVNEWTQILLNKIPRNVVTGQILNNQIRCSGLVTSMHVEILYTILPNHEEIDSYKIAGVALTFSEPEDLSWTKCSGNNCSDVMGVELTSLVTFADISTPSMYHYAGGPSLDISLPYDFFYPFMSSANDNQPFDVLLGLIFVNVILNYVDEFLSC